MVREFPVRATRKAPDKSEAFLVYINSQNNA